MTSNTKATMERAIVGSLWAILITYIGWSGYMIMENSAALRVLDERTKTILSRVDKTEDWRDSISTLEHQCLSRNKAMLSEVETLHRHVATDSLWSKQIIERINDLKERIRALEGKK